VARIQHHWTSYFRLDRNRRRAPLPVHFDYRSVVRVLVIGDGPGHARREVVLEGFAPAPDRGLIGDVFFSVNSDDGVL
jgi:hypothetical protein